MNIYFKGTQYKIHDYIFYISYKNVFFSKKTNSYQAHFIKNFDGFEFN